MKDQIDHLHELGAPASVINSTVPFEVQKNRIERAIRGELKLLYVSPERFQNDVFRSALRQMQVSLFAVDEAHCVSLWGHDIRPDYLRLRKVVAELHKPQVIALTATATPAVRTDILQQLGIEDAVPIVSGFDRPNLYLEVREPATVAEKIHSILELCAWQPSGIIYAGTRRNVEDIHRTLQRAGINAAAYHAGLTMPERKAVQERFMSRQAGIIVATNAFGMGIDRSDVRFVVHADIPQSLEAYYQEIGRAGRDGEPARCLLLFNYADKWIPESFIDSSHPPPEYLRDTFARLASSQSAMVVGDQWKRISGSYDQRFHAAVSLLQRAGYLERINSANGRGIRILRPSDRQLSAFNFEELERRRQFEFRKLAVMLQYASRFKRHCFRSYTLRYFGEWSKVKVCDNCSRCAPHKYAKAAKQTQNSDKRPVAETMPAGDPGRSTVVALKILSCVLRAQERIGREKVAKILAGSNDASIKDYRSLTTYGILSDYSISAIVSMIDHLIGEGYMEGGDGYRPVVRVSIRGREVLKDRSPISIPGV
jgi:ATP-dependent DNA helicase RecQ